MFCNAIKAGLLTGLALSLAASAAVASPTTFGSFSPAVAGRNFHYKNLDVVNKTTHVITPKAELVTDNGGPTLVNFTALINGNGGSGIAASDIMKADFSLDAFSNAAVVDNGLGNPSTQLFDGSFSFFRHGTTIDLLTGTFTGAVLSAKSGNFSLTINGSSSSGGTVVYSSDVFPMGVVNDFSIGATGLSTSIKYSLGHSFNYKGGFTGTATGNFSTVIAEPSATALMGLGLGALGVVARRRKAAAV